MKIAFKISALFALIIFTGGLGFFLGFRKGSEVVSNLASQNQVSSALSRMNSSLNAIKRKDISYSLSQHQRDLGSALFDLSAYAPAVPYWKCEVRDKIIIGNVKEYLSTHPDISGLPPKELLDQALKFCQ